MIRSFRHRGLQAFYEGQSARKVAPEHLKRIGRVLALLDASREPADMDIPGLKLHRLKGSLDGHWAVWISGNWRVTFRFENADAVDVDYH